MREQKEHTRRGIFPRHGSDPIPPRGTGPRRSNRFSHPIILLGYSVATLMTVMGIAVLFGMIIDEGVPERLRIMFGIVLTLMGGYRYVLTWSRAIQKRREDEDDE